ncbi:DNA-binding transcriptional LysR family regulator [Paracoccus versutus]|uniref:DNA-binding transcriptional LysR family regulator n=1 Tax=Paracoccus versutus TaxID=34007 RepID=A0AAQ0KJJ1_PARVE|nr:LysR family transcriptional regulator [Paracoccus versutus]REG28343.1 DNA-binding transcriptional LysR family regulator [Paracoccus versutus]
MPAQKTPELRAPKWDRLRTVLALGRHGTLSAAARALGVDHSTVARHLESLEQDLGARLFERAADGFRITVLGEEVMRSAERMDAEVHGLLRRAEGAAASLTGLVRMTTPPFLAAKLFAPALPAFFRRYPGLRLELLGESRNLDLYRREADVAVRLSRPREPGMVVRRIGEIRFACYAAASDPRPFEVQDYLTYDDGSGHETARRHLETMVPSERILLRSNATHTLLEAARAGSGCALLPCLAAEGDASLRELAMPQPLPAMPLWLSYHEDLRRSPRLRAAVGFMEEVVHGGTDL